VAIRITDPDMDPDTDPDPYRDTGKTCLGGGMHCPSVWLVRTFCWMEVQRKFSY